MTFKLKFGPDNQETQDLFDLTRSTYTVESRLVKSAEECAEYAAEVLHAILNGDWDDPEIWDEFADVMIIMGDIASSDQFKERIDEAISKKLFKLYHVAHQNAVGEEE